MENRKTGNAAASGTPFPGKNILMFNGYSAIQSCICDKPWSGCLYLEENMLLIVREGTLRFRYGNTAYEVGKNQMAFLKKDILICLETYAPPEKFLYVHYMLFS